MKINDIIMTPDGEGILLEINEYGYLCDTSVAGEYSTRNYKKEDCSVIE